MGISDNLVIRERTYRTPIETEYQENNTGRVRYYNASSNSAIVILPQRGGGYNFAQLIAAYLATNGISAYVIETPFHGKRLPSGVKSICDVQMDLAKLKGIFRQAVTETRSLIDLVEEEKIGICGISLGAIYASIVYGVDERVSSACLIAGCGNLADLIYESEDIFANHLRNYLIEIGIKRKELKESLKEIEPCNYIDRSKSRNLLMVNGRKDKDAPLDYAQDLAKAWGNPKQILTKRGHVSMVLDVHHLLPEILNHFRKTLE